MKILSILVPVFNEEKTIKKLINNLLRVDIGPFKKEIIIVNDHSSDLTGKKLARYRKHPLIRVRTHERNRGKGAAIRTALKSARGEFAIIQDADFEYEPADIKRLLTASKNNHGAVIYGSRYKGKHIDTLFHKLGNRFVTLTTNILYGCYLTDMETCYKLLPREIYSALPLKSDRFNIEPEITAKILKHGHRIVEVPISYHKRTFFEGKKLKWWKDGFSAVWTLVKFRFID